jgi:serine/threonine protein phosphatase PrpC
LTKDHLYVTERLGLEEESARDHPLKNRLSRAVGVAPKVDVEISELRSEPGDRVLLCTDGLSGCLSEDEIAACLSLDGPQEIVERLLGLADARESNDNSTALVVCFGRRDPEPLA